MLRRHWRKRNSRRAKRRKPQRAAQPWVPRQSSQACCSAWPEPWVALGSEPRHARVLTPVHGPEYDTHATTYVTHHSYEPTVATYHTTDQGTAAVPTSVH